MTLRQIYPAARVDGGCLRVAVAAESLVQPRWVSVMLEALAESGAGRLAAAIRIPATPSSPRADSLAYRLYARADAAYSSRFAGEDGALLSGDIGPLVAGLPMIEELVTRDQVQPEALARLRQLQLDVIVHLGSTPPPVGLAGAARYGVWRYCHGDGVRYGNGPPMFWELYDGFPITSVLLHLFTAGHDRPRIICRGTASTHPLSLFLNRQKPYLMSAPFVASGLRALQRHGPAMLAEWSEKPATGADAIRAAARRPGNLDVIRLVAKILRRRLSQRWKGRRGGWWFMAVRPRLSASSNRDGGPDNLAGFRPLPLPPGRFHADPFLFEQDGRSHLFFEDVEVAHKRGVISHRLLDGDGHASPPRVVLERSYHLSYPFIFRWRDEIFMLPETAQNKTIELYRAEEFPHRWVLDRRLLEGWRATDATLHCDEQGRWWMFATIDECGGGTWNQLFLFQADSPLGPWRPHPPNPIVSDVRWARPGGRLFRRDGKLIRPAQDCATHYGSGLWLMEVLELNETRYRESPLRRLGPGWLAGNHCLHHLDSTDRFEIIDGMRWRPGEAAS